MEKKKVLIITSTFPRWKNDADTSPFVYFLSDQLSNYFNVFVLAPYSKGSKKNERINKIQVKRFKYWFNLKNNLADGAILPNLKKNKLLWLQVPFFIISEFYNLIRICKKENIKSIHAHWLLPQGLLAVLYKKLFDSEVKVVVTSHGADIFGAKRFNIIKKWVINNCSTLTVVSHAIKKEVLKLKIKKSVPIKVIPMGVNLSKFNPNNYDEAIKVKYKINGTFLLFVGRLTEKKGVKYLIEAMPKIIKIDPKAKLLIIGSGEEKDMLKNLANELGLLDKHIIFTGAIPNSKLPPFFATADIFISPSIIAKDGDREGLPVTYMEAAASGCALIGSDLEGNKDIIIDGKTGLMVKQKSSDDIAKAVLILLKNKKYKNKLIKSCYNLIKHKLSWDKIANDYKKVLK